MRIPLAVVVTLSLFLRVPAQAAEKPLHKFLPIEDKSNVSLAYIWLDIAEEIGRAHV